MIYAMQATEIRKTVIEKFSILGQSNILDASKIPLDIYLHIVESDYQYKRVIKPLMILKLYE